MFNKQDYKATLKESGCDGAMIARGAIQSPWCFRQLTSSTDSPVLPSLIELDKAEKEYFELARDRKTKDKYIEWHTEGFRRIRVKVLKTS